MSLLTQASLVVTPNGVKEGKLYSVIPSDGSGDMSVTRATTATRVNSAGLVELVPYNLLSWSEDFTNGWFAYLGSITATANYGTAPDGTNTSTRILFTSNNQIWAKAISLTGVNGTFSVWIKGVTGQTIGINYGGTDNVVTLQSGWNRYTVTGVGTIDFVFINTFGSTATDIEVWGGQVVEGSTAKDYQKTETRLNIPRLDYSNGTCPSLLVEPQRTNKITYSENQGPSGTNWWPTSTWSVTNNSIISPSGIQNADTLTEDTSNGYHAGYFNAVISNGFTGTYTISVYAKYNGRFLVLSPKGASERTYFNLQDGTIAQLGGGGVTANIEDCGNGWYRCSVTCSFSSENVNFEYLLASAVGTLIYIGNGTSGVHIWGAQAEEGSYATSYIPTTSASVTRNADVISKTGISSLKLIVL